MSKMLICQKTFLDEKNRECSLDYSLLVYADEFEKAYGVEIRMTDARGIVEADAIVGISRKREEAEAFIRKLWAETALPVELAALCDDFISEREWLGEYKMALAAS